MASIPVHVCIHHCLYPLCSEPFTLATTFRMEVDQTHALLCANYGAACGFTPRCDRCFEVNSQYSFGLVLLFRLGVSHCWDYP